MFDSDRHQISIIKDSRFQRGLDLFNRGEWYLAHDEFEELWHEIAGPERQTIQGFLQVAVAQLHLERGNVKGAMILFGEGLGRLRFCEAPDFGLDLDSFCNCIDKRLKLLQMNDDTEFPDLPILMKKELNDENSFYNSLESDVSM